MFNNTYAQSLNKHNHKSS